MSKEREELEELKKELEADVANESIAGKADEEREEEIKKPDEISLLKEENEKLREDVMRAKADYFNLRTRTEKQRETNAILAAESAVNAMLPVFENLERIADALTNKEDAVAKGIMMVQKQFAESLESLGLEFIEAEGDFDPTLHEAIFMEPVEDEALDGKIIGAVSRGYKLGGRVLRASKVRVGKFNG
ncbi:MAG: nucleotide exchange factor GrpE [Synergistaceae bacterium]|nr:nucleotide exchange factor GrpE [Synergistaceae bacterium]